MSLLQQNPGGWNPPSGSNQGNGWVALATAVVGLVSTIVSTPRQVEVSPPPLPDGPPPPPVSSPGFFDQAGRWISSNWPVILIGVGVLVLVGVMARGGRRRRRGF